MSNRMEERDSRGIWVKQNLDCGLIAIGCGSAGLTAAGSGLLREARVALVERDRTGGDRTWTGCVPSRALRTVPYIL
jgi:pyruvate/2-oxoglutarate dehydrogenase complex dihydrolipoamide dehydrogenase (E3) component